VTKSNPQSLKNVANQDLNSFQRIFKKGSFTSNY